MAGARVRSRAKSDLRWLEAGALGIPIIASPEPYRDIEHGVTRFHARNARQVRELLRQLVQDQTLRTGVGENARDHVRECRSMKVMADEWRDTIARLLGPQAADAAADMARS